MWSIDSNSSAPSLERKKKSEGQSRLLQLCIWRPLNLNVWNSKETAALIIRVFPERHEEEENGRLEAADRLRGQTVRVLLISRTPDFSLAEWFSFCRRIKTKFIWLHWVNLNSLKRGCVANRLTWIAESQECCNPVCAGDLWQRVPSITLCREVDLFCRFNPTRSDAPDVPKQH